MWWWTIISLLVIIDFIIFLIELAEYGDNIKGVLVTTQISLEIAALLSIDWLVRTSNEGFYLLRENKLSIDNIFITFQNNQITIARDTDMFFPKYLFSNHHINYLQLIIVRAMNHNLLQILSGMSLLHTIYDFFKIKNISENKHYMKCYQCHKNYIF